MVPPLFNGGSAISSYVLKLFMCTPGITPCKQETVDTVNPTTARPLTIGSLVSRTSYWLTIQGTNKVGVGLPSATVRFTGIGTAANTVTTISSPTTNPAVGQMITFDVNVSGQSTGTGALTPSGKVTVFDGTRSCLASLSGAGGRANGSCTLAEVAPGSYSFTATYSGDSNFYSSTSSVKKLVVMMATSKTTLGLSASSIVYGQEQNLKLSVATSAEFSGIPTGTVTVWAGKTVLCKVTLSAGKGNCSPASRAVVPGTYSLAADYGGSSAFDSSTSSAEKLVVIS